MTTTSTTRVALAEAALEKFDTKIAELADIERAATRAMAKDPTDDAAKKVRAARTELDDWKHTREIALANLEAARAEAASEETASHAAKARELAAKASRRAFRAALAPHVERLVQLRDEAGRTWQQVERVIEEQRRTASEANQHAAAAGIDLDVPRFETGDAIALLLPAMSSGNHMPVRHLFESVTDDLARARRVFDLLGLGDPFVLRPHMSLDEAIDRALDGEDIYASTRPVAAAAE